MSLCTPIASTAEALQMFLTINEFWSERQPLYSKTGAVGAPGKAQEGYPSCGFHEVTGRMRKGAETSKKTKTKKPNNEGSAASVHLPLAKVV